MIPLHIILSITLCVSSISDTLSMSQARQMLPERNAELRAAHIEQSKHDAMVRQARRWENPEITGSYNLYNPVTHTWLDAGPEGETDISISQPLPIGRRRRVQLAEASRDAGQAHTEWLSLSLLMQLQNQMGTVLSAQQRIALTAKELTGVERILEAYHKQPQSVSAMEIRRIETWHLTLLTEQAEQQQVLDESLSTLRLLLVLPPETDITIAPWSVAWPEQLPIAPSSSPRIRQQQALVAQAQAEVRVQKAESLPRVSVLAEYDKNGNIGHNFFAAGVALTLPLLNRNQDGIRTAELSLQQQQLEQELTSQSIAQEIALASHQLERCRQLHTQASQQADWNIEAAERQYLQRNISLLELMDYYNAWHTAQELLITARQQLLEAIAAYNLAIGTEVITVQ